MGNGPIVYVNGDFRLETEARPSVFDLGFQFGDGIYEVVSAWRGTFFKLDAHIRRLQDGLRAARLETGLGAPEWRAAIMETARRNGLRDASVKVIVTRGVLPPGSSDPRQARPNVFIMATPYGFIGSEEQRRTGIRLQIGHQRGMAADALDPRYKHISRLQYQLSRLEALEAGYDDVVWLSPQGQVEEAPRSNLFVVKAGVLRTPAQGVLHGITRETFAELAQELAIPFELAAMTAYDLFTADEVFTCSTSGGALPVREVSGRKIPDPVPGPVTHRLDEAYWAMRESGHHGDPM
jgi:branched-chain amino acid aminotransferase